MAEMPRWIYVAGTGRSGSTLLASLLAQVTDAFDCGELHLLWESLVDGRICACGVEIAHCEVWADVAKLVREEVGLADNEDGAAIARRRLRQRELLLPRVPPPRQDEVALRRATERAVETVTGAPTLVDSSKLSSVLWTATARVDRPLIVAHLVRDPRAVAFSWRRPKADPSLGGEPLRSKTSARASVDWLRTNLATTRVARRASFATYVPLRYEDLTARPREALRPLAGEIAGPLVAFAETDSQSHSVGGNPGRYIADQPIHTDMRWRDEMRSVDRVIATALTFPLLRRFSYPFWPR